ncbi:MAG: hypothetical protein M1308_15300 [Actinobacteria bacterium]|nr:hypothetical protein [Actinomycetota bacterium]
MNFSNKDKLIYPRVFMAASIAAIVLAGVGYLGNDIWLASTQWLLIAAIFALFGVYLRLEE